MDVKTTMDFFHHRYFRLNKILLKSLGLWPYQSPVFRYFMTIVCTSVALSILVPQVMTVSEHLDDLNFLTASAIPIIFGGFGFTKVYNSQLNSRKRLILLNRMRTNWEVYAQDRDADVLHEYAEKGRKSTILWAVLASTTCIGYLSQPVIPKLIDVLLKNGTEPGEFPIPIEYYFCDMQKYYFYIIFHCSLCTSLGFLISIADDSMFMVYVQHNCGLFAALGRKLERLGENEEPARPGEISYGSKKPVMEFDYLASCVDQHNAAIEYAELIGGAYSWSFFVLAGLSTLMISLMGVQVMTRTNEVEETIKFLVCNITSMVNLYTESYMSQSLMDHSISIRNYILNAKWYRVPLRAQKILLLMIMRCNVPCKVTAGYITVMSVRTFGVILKTSMSYIAVLRSL